jgi:hypothetical protein
MTGVSALMKGPCQRFARGQLRWVGLILGVLVCVDSSAVARFDPNETRRMAVTDRSTNTGVQPRVWLVTLDNGLTSKRPDVADGGWLSHSPGGYTIESGLDAVSWTDGVNQRVRVFYAGTSGATNMIRMLNYDNDTNGGTSSLPDIADTFTATDVASVTWSDAGTQRIAVAAVASNGNLCVWEGTFTGGFSLAPSCTGSGWASVATPDVVGTVYSGTPVFFARRADFDLGRVRRTAFNTYTATDLGRPSGSSNLNPSMFVAPSTSIAGLEIGFSNSSGTLYYARVSLTGTTPTFASLPGLAGTLSSGSTSITGLRYFWPGGDRLVFYAKDDAGLLYRLFNIAGSWGVSWGAGARPPDEEFRGCGAASVRSDLVNGDTPILFGAAGRYAGFWGGWVMQEHDGSEWRDHIRFQSYPNDILGAGYSDLTETSTGVFEANESAVAVGSFVGLGTAIRRGELAPWRVVVDYSIDGAFSWGNDIVVTPLPRIPASPASSLTDPFVAVARSNESLHHLALQVEHTNSTFTCAPNGSFTRQLVYRRGGSALAIANNVTVGANLKIVADASSLDHGGLVVTSDASGDVTAHVIYTELAPANEVRYWRLLPDDSETTSVIAGLTPPTAPTILSAGSNTLYGTSGLAQPTVCPLPSGSCGAVGGVSPINPPAVIPDIFFGASSASKNQATHQTCQDATSGNWFRCFDTQQPFGLRAHPVLTSRLYAVWPTRNTATNQRAIYFSRTTDIDLNTWTTPVAVTPFATTFEFVDPEITVAADGTLVVTYSEIQNFAVSAAGVPRMAYSTDHGMTWSSPVKTWPTWSPIDLGFHCTREKFFLGEYRNGGQIGNRVYNLMPESVSGAVGQTGVWSSRWSLN